MNWPQVATRVPSVWIFADDAHMAVAEVALRLEKEPDALCPSRVDP
jgi:hypothetical protein